MKAIAAILVTVPLALWRGFVLSVMWGWYVVPTFGLPALSPVVAVGVIWTVHLFYMPIPKPEERGKPVELVYPFLYGLVSPAVALAFGWAWRFLL